MIVDKEKFFEIQSKMDFISYDQALGYHDLYGNREIVYFVDNINEPNLCVWAVINRKFKFLSILKITGESFSKQVTHKIYSKFYKHIIEESEQHDIITIVNNNKYSIDFEMGIRLAGFIRPIAFFDSPLSIVMDFNKENIRSRNWRRNVEVAKKNNLDFKYITNPTQDDIVVFVKMCNELSERKGLGSYINEENISNMLLDENYYLFFVYIDDLPLAGRIVYVHREHSYDVYAANSNKAIENRGTTYFMMESIFEFLKSLGVNYFDFGRIGIGHSDGVASFKLYSGGEVINYNSSWEYSNNIFLSSLVSIVRSIRSKRY
ncbi:MAG: GNAT family N-acetyltransferase [Bacteroidia bacterium]|jgi:hypothetical protein|nr:GNAT family N-acetyltransferase [Bacteroidia bacterium]